MWPNEVKMPSIGKRRGRWSCRVRKKNGSSIRKTFDTQKEALAWGANWLANITRGTNEFAHCSHLIYLHNKHPNPVLTSWLGVGKKHYSDAHALTELIQWV